MANVPSREISQQSHKMWKDLPEFLHWKPGMETLIASDYDAGLLMSLHLDYLYNDFLLYRILAKRTEARSETLIAVSRDILSTLLVFISNGSRSVRAGCDVGWNVRPLPLKPQNPHTPHLNPRYSHLRIIRYPTTASPPPASSPSNSSASRNPSLNLFPPHQPPPYLAPAAPSPFPAPKSSKTSASSPPTSKP
jgi:hypothetical protein